MRHDHNHEQGHNHEHGQSEPAFATPGELNGENSTGKPNFNWNQAAEQISRTDRKWDGGALGSDGTVTYSFLSSAQAGQGFDRLTTAQTNATEKAMALWSQIANIDFTPAGGGSNVSTNGELQFKGYDGGGGGWASWSTRGGGETSEMSRATVALGGSSLSLALHEVGHAIGLSHPGDYNGGGFNYDRDAEFYQDSDQYTVMSYWRGGETGAALRGATGPGLFDIAAIQRVYGANTDTYSGNTTYGFNSNTGDSGWTLTGRTDWVQAAIWDGGGRDTIDMSGYSSDAEIDLRPEAFSSTGGLKYNLAIARGVVIENAIGGSGDDVLTGNGARNELQGQGGRDTIDAANGNDTVFGQAGNDALRGGLGDDRLNGGGANDKLWGNANRDTLYGGAGNDRLQGGGGGDTFLFKRNEGADEITDFTAGLDQIRFHKTGLSYADLDISNIAGGSEIDYGTGTISLNGVRAAALDADDFIFS